MKLNHLSKHPFSNVLFTLSAVAILSACGNEDPQAHSKDRDALPGDGQLVVQSGNTTFEEEVSKLKSIKYVGALAFEGGLGDARSDDRRPKWQVLLCIEQGASRKGHVDFDIPENLLGIQYYIANNTTHRVRLGDSHKISFDYEYNSQEIEPYQSESDSLVYGMPEFKIKTTDLSFESITEDHSYALAGQRFFDIHYRAHDWKFAALSREIRGQKFYIQHSAHTLMFRNGVVGGRDAAIAEICEEHQQDVLVVPANELISPTR